MDLRMIRHCLLFHFHIPSINLILTAISHLNDGKPDYVQSSAFNIPVKSFFL